MPGPAPAQEVLELADRLWRAQLERSPIAPLSQTRPDLRLEDAYAIATHNVRRRVAAGAVPRGHKVGLTSRIVQDVFGVSEPTFGVLLDDMFVDAGAQV